MKPSCIFFLLYNLPDPMSWIRSLLVTNQWFIVLWLHLAPFITELKQCPIVDKNQVLLYPMQEQSIKARVAAGKYKEDTSLLPSSINRSPSTFTNIWLNVNIAVLLLTSNTINSLLQNRKCRQIETNWLKL